MKILLADVSTKGRKRLGSVKGLQFSSSLFLYKNTKKPIETGTIFFICVGLLPKTSGLRRNRRTNDPVGSPAQQSFLRINRNK